LKSWLSNANISSADQGEFMPVKKENHKHPEVEQRVKAIEPKVKTLEKTVRDLQHQLKTHDHPHTH
jgi:chaperonin cofactor prefoldin